MRLSLALAALLLLALARPAAAADKLTVVLDWFVNPDHGTLIVAQEKGFFRDQGLDVELVAPADSNDPPKLVAAGKADVAVDYQPQLTLQVDQGLPLVRIGTLIDTPLNTLAVLAEGPITAIAGLKGKKIGYSVGGFESVLLTSVLKQAGLTPADVTLVNVNFNLAPALLSRQVDAVIGAYRNFELNQLALAGHPGRGFYVEENGVPVYDELVLVANAAKLADPRLPRFLAAVEQGALYVANHPDDSLKLFVKGRPELDDELNRRAWADTVGRFAKRPFALDHGRYQRFAEFLVKTGMIKQTRPLADYAVELPR